MGLKRGAIENTLGEHTGNLMGTHWELEGNKGKMKKILLPNPTPQPCPQRKKTWAPWLHSGSPHPLQEFLLPTCILLSSSISTRAASTHIR
jgi:hypothetical protein